MAHPQDGLSSSNQIAVTTGPTPESFMDDTIYPGVPSAQAIYAQSLLDNPDTNPFDAANAVSFATPTMPKVDWRAITGLALQARRIQQEQAAAAQRTWMDTAITSAARVGLPVVGGMLGALGGPVGAAAGAATGGFIGEDLAEMYEVSRGQRDNVNPLQVATQGALSAIPGSGLRAGMGVVRQLPRVAGISTGIAGVSSGATQLADTGAIDPSRFAIETAMGGAIGTGLGSAGVALQNPAVRQALADERGSIQIGPPNTNPTRQIADAPAGQLQGASSRTGTGVPVVAGAGPNVPDGEWSRIAGEQLPARARGVLDQVPVPASMTPAGLPANQPAVTARINRFIERHDSPAEVKDTLREILETGDDYALQAQRRMGMTWEQLDAEASRILPRINLPRGSAISAEEMGALRRTTFGLIQRSKDVSADMVGLTQLEALVAGGDQQAAQELSALLAKYGVADLGGLRLLEQQATLEAMGAVSSMMGTRSESGRVLNYLKSFQKARVTNDADFLAAALKRGAIPEEAMAALRVMPDDLARFRYLRALAKPGAQDYWRWYAMTSYLSSMVTQWRNTSGNAVNFGAEALLATPASMIDAVRNPGARTVVLSENQAAAAGLASGFLDGVHKARFFFRNGFTLKDADSIADIPPEVFGGALLPNVVGRAMGATDQFFRTIGLHMELHRAATVQGVNEGLSGVALRRRVQELVDDPTITPEIHKRAERYAAGMVYQDTQTGVVGEGLGAIRGAFSRWPDKMTQAAADKAWELGLSKLGVLGHPIYAAMSFPPSVIIAPFIRTPFNILKRSVEYSPAGMLMAAQGGSRDAMYSAARGAVGTAFLGLGAGLWLQGRLTGGPPKDAAERDAWYAEGKKPYAVLVNGAWVSYQHYGQFGILLAALANYADSAWREPTNYNEKFGHMVSAVGNALIDNSMLRQMNLFIDALSDTTGRYRDRLAGRMANDLAGFAGARRDVRSWTDPVVRDPEGIGEHLQAGTPRLSDNVEPRIDYTGQEIQRQASVLPTEAKPPDFRQELIRLRAVTEGGYLRDPNAAAQSLQRKLNDRLKKAGQPQVLIPRAEHTKYAKKYGDVSATVLREIVATRAYRDATDDDKRKMIERAKDLVTEQVDALFVQRYLDTGVPQ